MRARFQDVRRSHAHRCRGSARLAGRERDCFSNPAAHDHSHRVTDAVAICQPHRPGEAADRNSHCDPHGMEPYAYPDIHGHPH